MKRIDVNDSCFLKGLSSLNWICHQDLVCATTTGASLKLRFRDTALVSLVVDTESLRTFSSPSRCPVIAWSVNEGGFQEHQLLPGEKEIVLSDGKPDPRIELYVKGFSPFEERFKGDVPLNSVQIRGCVIEDKGWLELNSPASRVWLNIGDSIFSGDGASGKKGAGRPKDDFWPGVCDGRGSYCYLLAKHFGYSESKLAFGGYNWNGGYTCMPGVPALLENATSSIRRIKEGKLNPSPEVVLINLGENGAPAESDVIVSLAKTRSVIDVAAKLIIMIPVSGDGRMQVSQAFHDYRKQSGDTACYLVDLGLTEFETMDGQHPTALGHREIFRKALPFFTEIIQDASIKNEV